MACRPFYDWLEEIVRQAMDTGYYGSWCMDGDFWGTGSYYHTTVPVSCLAENHDHLPGERGVEPPEHGFLDQEDAHAQQQ